MNWRIIRWVLVIILVVLNLGLFIYSKYRDYKLYVVPEERIEQLIRRYEDWGYELPDTLPRRQFPKKRLLLAQNDLEARGDSFWTDEVEKSYMVDARVLYTHEAETLTVDRDHSNMIYSYRGAEGQEATEGENTEEAARAFARQMTETEDLVLIREVRTAETTTVYYFCEQYDGQVIFANQTAVTMVQGVITRGVMTQYRIQGYSSEERAIYPIDELLYGGLKRLGRSEEKTVSLTLYYGYQISRTEEEEILCDPTVAIILEDGTGELINWYLGSFETLV